MWFWQGSHSREEVGQRSFEEFQFLQVLEWQQPQAQQAQAQAQQAQVQEGVEVQHSRRCRSTTKYDQSLHSPSA